MRVPWKTLAHIGLEVIKIVIPQIGLVEQLADAIPLLRGSAKADAAITLTKEALKTVESVKHLAENPEVEAALRQFVSAYVALQHVVAAHPPA